MTTAITNLDGYFKTRYVGKLERLQPSFSILSKKFAFNQKAKLGKDYRFPVRVRRSNGITFAGGASYGTAFALNAANSGQTEEAVALGSEFVLREAIAYGVLAKATSDMEAFGDAFDEIVADMVTSAAFYRELTLLYGGTSIGAITGTPGQPTSTTATCVISAASWAPGAWSQIEGAYVDVWNAALSTQRNTDAALQVINVDSATRTITVEGDASDIDALANTDVFVPRGANNNWFTGMDKIMTNTGTLFDINGATYNLWLATQYAVGGVALTMAKVTGAAARIVPRSGLRDLTCMVSTYTWTDMNNDLAAIRRFVESTKGGLDIGTQGDEGNITYYGPNGTIRICPHPMVKAGEAFMFDEQHWDRFGATDTTFRLPNAKGQQENFFSELPDNAGVSLRCYWDQGLICRKPNTAAKLTGIVNTAG